MNYWLHRISHLAEVSYPLLDKGYLCIGYVDYANPETIDKVLQNDKVSFDKDFLNVLGFLPRNRNSLWNFLSFKKGDIIIVPSWGTFFVCEIIDDKPLLISEVYTPDLKAWNNKNIQFDGNVLLDQNGKVYDLGFARKIKILHKDISRDKFADATLTARMKIRQTNACINDLKQSVENSIQNYQQNKPIHLHSILQENTCNLILETLKKELNPDKFEKTIKIYFETIGANCVKIPSKNEREKEGDADIVANFENLKLIIYVQAKFQSGTIGDWATQQISDYKENKDRLDDGYSRIAWVITTAENFSDEAHNKAKEENIQLINGTEFSKMLLNAGLLNYNTNI